MNKHSNTRKRQRKNPQADRAYADRDSREGINPQANPDAAGIDIGAQELVAAVPPGRSEGAHVRTFSSFTHGIQELRDWLVACRIRTAVIESTGNYWITTYNLLEAAGIEVCLVNARHVKGVPGKKTDVEDACWLQQLHAAGLLRKSFRPSQEIIPLRYLMRHRADLVAQSAQQTQLMQKVLTEMNLHIHHVFSDIDGLSAQTIITAILEGERDAQKLAALRHKSCRSPLQTIIDALRGDYREEYLFVLKQCQRHWLQIQSAIAECDSKMSAILSKIEPSTQEPLPAASYNQRQPQKNMPNLPIYQEAWRFYGVDLSAIPGVGGGLLAVLMSELGPAQKIRSSFPSAGAMASWLALCPDNRISGGRVLKAKTRKVTHRLASALRLAAFAVGRADNAMGDYCRKMKARLGKAEGIVAVAHKIARIIYAMVTTGKAYDEAEAFKTTPSAKARRLSNLRKQAKKLGMQLLPAT